jgi:hypothetical protein
MRNSRACPLPLRERVPSRSDREGEAAEPQLQSIEFMPSFAGGMANEAKTAAKGPR